VPIRDEDAMTNQILKFSQMDVEEISKVKKQIRVKVEQQHSEELMIIHMLNLYNKIT
jgi:hypothetical protein